MVKAYNAFTDSAQRLSEHFTVGEFQCHDGSGALLISVELVTILEKIRAYFGKPVTVNSGYRNETYNAKQGGAAESQHCKGTAADITISGVKPTAIAAYAETLMPTSGGIGLYEYVGGFTHIDVRATRARWKHTSATGPELSVSKFV